MFRNNEVNNDITLQINNNRYRHQQQLESKPTWKDNAFVTVISRKNLFKVGVNGFFLFFNEIFFQIRPQHEILWKKSKFLNIIIKQWHWRLIWHDLVHDIDKRQWQTTLIHDFDRWRNINVRWHDKWRPIKSFRNALRIWNLLY